MTAVAVCVLVEVLRVRVDGLVKETSAARRGAAPEGYEDESPGQIAREAVAAQKTRLTIVVRQLVTLSFGRLARKGV